MKANILRDAGVPVYIMLEPENPFDVAVLMKARETGFYIVPRTPEEVAKDDFLCLSFEPPVEPPEGKATEVGSTPQVEGQWIG